MIMKSLKEQFLFSIKNQNQQTIKQVNLANICSFEYVNSWYEGVFVKLVLKCLFLSSASEISAPN